MKCASVRFAACAIVVVVSAIAQAQQKPCATASKFGPDDQIGNVNYITPAKTLAATKLITKGKAYRLGIETNKDTPAYGTRTFNIIVLQPGQIGGATIGPTKTTYNDDIINGWVGIGSQLDGFGHIGIDSLHFNCNKAADFAMPDGLKKLGIENVPAVATRGVLLDMAGYFGVDIVKEGTPFNRALMASTHRNLLAAHERQLGPYVKRTVLQAICTEPENPSTMRRAYELAHLAVWLERHSQRPQQLVHRFADERQWDVVFHGG
jgi:hypothetical protein